MSATSCCQSRVSVRHGHGRSGVQWILCSRSLGRYEMDRKWQKRSCCGFADISRNRQEDLYIIHVLEKLCISALAA